ncbi:hypothetical protein SDC9_20257 [bioreactor metagenome]|uniref:Uncharacterized protein n=1 Tax=bioreactor metagenome TaxID=1076179 RepID=A0A644U626_9ZZZZ
MENYIIGDIIRIRNYCSSNSTRVKKEINLFKIVDFAEECFTLDYYKIKAHYEDIEPVPINKIDDKEIYYDPVVAGSFILPGDPAPVIRKDYSYYLDHFQRCRFKNNSYYELIRNNNLKYVHEVQHYLLDTFKHDNLRIKDF